MNASLWQLAGWTMIHSLWLGAAVALVGGFLRLACRRATPNTRYAISLATLALLAAVPIAAAGWLSVNGVPQLAATSPSLRYSGERLGEGQNDQGTWPARNAGATNENPFLAPPLPGTDLSDLQSSASQIIDLANPNSSPQPSGTWSGEGFAALPATPHAKVTIGNPSPASSLPPSALPIPPTSNQSPITSHLSTLIPHLPTLWLIGAPLTFTLLATGLIGSERLRRRATPLTAGPAFDACQRLRQTLTITRRVALAVCDDVAQPILVGIVRPLILLPAAALAGWTPEQLDMVLLHELAHVRRWDNLVNLLQRIVESLLFFHPAVWLVSRQVRRDREECCDDAVIRHTDRPEAYATLLIDIASRLRLSGQLSPTQSLTVASAMASHPLAGRIRRILNIEAEPMRITRRTLAATLLLPLLLAGAIFYSGASAEDTPSAKEQSSEVDAGDATDSTSLNNAKEPDEASARAKLIDDKLEELDPAIRRVYPIPPGTLVDPIELAKALKSRRPAEIEWAVHQQGIILSAPEDVHERVAALIKTSAAKTAKFTDDTFKPVTAHNLVDGDNAPLVGGYGILEEFAADADPSTIDAAIERLKAEKRSFSVEQSDNGSKRIVDQTPPSKKPTTKKPPTLEDNSSSYKQIRDLFTATDANPAVTVKYRAPPGVRKYVEDMFDGMENDPYGPQISFHRVWSDDERTVEITAPSFAQGLYLNTVFNALSLESNMRRLEKSRNPDDSTDAAATKSNDEESISEEAPFGNMKEFIVPFPPGSYSEDDYNRIRKSLEAERKFAVDSTPFASLDLSAGQLPSLKVFVHDHWNPKPVWETNGDGKKTLRIVNDAGGPGSPNHGAAATESSANDAQPTADASPNSIPLAQKPKTPANGAANAAVDSASPTEQEAEKLRRLFQESASNEQITKFYTVPQGSRQELETAIGVAAGKLFGSSKPPFQLKWEPDEDAVYVTAPELAHRGYFHVLFAAHKLSQFDYPPDAELPDYQAALAEVEKAQADAALAMEGLPPAHLPPAPFPTLENQKITDRAYKLLGLELEPLTPAELERVKKLGYNGGLRVAAFDPHKKNGIGLDALLVGLHVWPITDLQTLDAVLTREDLDDLSPLRFRTVVKASDSPLKQPEDRIISGRMPIDAEAFQSIQRSLPLNHANAAAVPPGDLSPYIGRNVNPAPAIADYQHPAHFAKALERSRKSSKPVIVHLLALDSAPSEQFETKVLADPQVADFIHKNFDAITIYPQYHPAFVKAFHIDRVPADMFIYAGGERIAGGVTPPATPELYLAHLKTHHKLATSTAIQNGDAPLVPAAPIAPAADRPDGNNQVFERPPSHVEGVKLVKEFPATINPDELRAVVEGYRQEGNDVWVERLPESNAIRVLVASKAAAAQPAAQQPTFLYDGKTFDQWRDLWKLELNPERRTEAINALAAFGRTGHGDEAAEAIFDVAGEYPENYSVNSPEAQLRSAIEAAVVRMPTEQWLPPLMKRMAEDNAKWRRLASQLLYGLYERSLKKGGEAQTSPETIELLKSMARDPKYGPNAISLDTLIRLLPAGDLELDQLIKEALTAEDTKNAVHVVGNLSYRRLEQFPEQFEFLFHNDPEIRRYARRVLPQASAKDAIAVADRLKAVLNDPQRSADHADAIRAMGELIRSIAKGGSTRLGSSVNAEDFEKKFRQPVKRLLSEGPPELLTPSLVALGFKVDDSSLIEQQLGDGLSAERKSLIQETLKKLAAEEKEVLPRQLGF